jgi:hypothetical protein
VADVVVSCLGAVVSCLGAAVRWLGAVVRWLGAVVGRDGPAAWLLPPQPAAATSIGTTIAQPTALSRPQPLPVAIIFIFTISVSFVHALSWTAVLALTPLFTIAAQPRRDRDTTTASFLPACE